METSYPKELFEEYVKYFGDKPPYPPEYFMRIMVDLKKMGIYDESVLKLLPLMEEIKSKHDMIMNMPVDPSDPLSLAYHKKAASTKKTKKTSKRSSTKKTAPRTKKTSTSLKKKPKTTSRKVKSKKAK